MALLPWDENRNLWEETEKEAPVLVLKGMQASEVQGEQTRFPQPPCSLNACETGFEVEGCRERGKRPD